MIVAIIIISMIIIATFTYMLILGANMIKSDKEKQQELEDEMNYWREQENGGKNSGNQKRKRRNL